MSTPSLPEPKAPPKRLRDSAKQARAEFKACHGTWYSHEVAQRHGRNCQMRGA